MLMFQPMNQNFSVPQESGGSIALAAMMQKHSPIEQKRNRDDDGERSHNVQSPSSSTTAQPETYEVPLQAPPPTSKRSRSNKYKAPREIKPSILSATGSLVGGVGPNMFTRVPLRRQLSGSAIDAFLGVADSMDTDNPSDPAGIDRPRSMSF
eukprot:scaffold13478_cov132-Cylindrotheca_fusiformis.AAC.41